MIQIRSFRFPTLLAALSCASPGCTTADSDDTTAAAAAPESTAAAELVRSEGAIAGQYIVVLHVDELLARGAGAAAVSAELASAVSAEVVFTYQHSISGFAARMSEAAARRLLADPRVAYVVEDSPVHANGIQINPPWGLDRIDQRNLPLSASYAYGTTGAGSHAYIIDTGIRATHVDFGGRVAKGFDAVTAGGSANDCNGHGTHLAGIVGGATYGVAKQVTLHPVRVLGCTGSGTTAGVIAGIDWITANHIKPAVANMSLGGSPNVALDAAVNQSLAAGVTYAVAAGGSGGSACNFSPARIPAALTVGSSSASDAVAPSSNKGPCLDLFAPGQGILSTWYTSDTATATLSGTSMATAFVAGAAARYLQSAPLATPAQVAAQINTTATVGVLTGVPPDTFNRLLYVAP